MSRSEARPDAPPGRGLGRNHFRKVAANGFGDGANSYPYCAAWFDGRLYIGTTRHALIVLKMRLQLEVPFETWPVPVPESDRGLDLRAQIWRYDPACRTWERVFRSPMTRGLEGREVPLSLGFRNMAVFQGRSDPRPAIYTIASCGTFGLGPVLFRCEDGRNFRPASGPGLGLGDPGVTTFRGVVPFKGRLFITPAGSRGGNPNTSYNAAVLCTDDPARGGWAASNAPSFGEPTNYGVFDIGTCGRYLYAGTMNVREGCQLWRTDGEGPPPHRWAKVFDRGADRGPFNQMIMSFGSLRDDLYVGTGIQNGGNDRLNNVGPAAGEVIRVHPDGSWDLVVGEPRITRRGLKVPTSGLGPGFDNPMTGYMWRMSGHDGNLYVGTFDAHTFLRFSDRSNWAEWSRKLNDAETFERYLSRRSGCELWRTHDGDHWTPVTRDGFGNPFNYGFRTVFSTPAGLFVGAANPFGPRVAVRGPAGWRYEDNPRGGLEIWHGSPDHVGGDAVGRDLLEAAPTTILPAPDGAAGLDPGDAPGDPASRHRTPGPAEETVEWFRDDPVGRTYAQPQDLVGLTEGVSEELDTYFSGGRLRNVGYWRESTTTPRQACGQLLRELLAFLPDGDPGIGRPLSILAVGVGMDDPDHGVARLRPRDTVVSLSHEDIFPPTPARRGLRSFFRTPRPAPDPWPGSSFDLVVWVEGLHAKGLPAALARAYHLLRPGGRFLAADAVAAAAPGDVGDAYPDPPEERAYVRDCFGALAAAGFVGPGVVDVTGKTWVPFHRHSRKFFAMKRRMRQIDPDQLARVLASLPGGASNVEAYVLVTATKP